MKVSETNIHNNIIPEYESWKEVMYAGKSKEERRKMGQFFTPPELTVGMIERFNTLDGDCLDSTCGAGNLLIGMVFAKFQYYNENCRLNSWNKTFQDCIDEIYGVELDSDILKVCHDRLQHLCDFIKIKYQFEVKFNPTHFQLGDALNDPLDCDEFWQKNPFEMYKKSSN